MMVYYSEDVNVKFNGFLKKKTEISKYNVILKVFLLA
jgi:hypothetical protein